VNQQETVCVAVIHCRPVETCAFHGKECTSIHVYLYHSSDRVDYNAELTIGKCSRLYIEAAAITGRRRPVCHRPGSPSLPASSSRPGVSAAAAGGPPWRRGARGPGWRRHGGASQLSISSCDAQKPATCVSDIQLPAVLCTDCRRTAARRRYIDAVGHRHGLLYNINT